MAKGQHKSDKEQYSSYKTLDKRQKNRQARLERHAKKHPNDAQAQNAAEVKPYKSKPHTKGNYPEVNTSLVHPITGQPMAEPAFAAWDGVYEPIPSKKRKRA